MPMIPQIKKKPVVLAAEPKTAQIVPLFVTPQVASAARRTRREQDVRIERLLESVRSARFTRKLLVTVSVTDLECALAEIKIPLDLARMLP